MTLRCCRICASDDDLTRHHLLLRRAARIHGLKNKKVWLCRACHDGLHKGTAHARAAAHDALRAVLSDEELAILATKPRREIWEMRLLA